MQSRVFLVSPFDQPAKQEGSTAPISGHVTSEIKTDQCLALKVFEKKQFKPHGAREFQLLNSIAAHPNIVKVFEYKTKVSTNALSKCSLSTSDISFDQDFDYISMEYCHNGDLFELVRKNGALPERLAKNLFLEILEGVEYLHSNSQIAHLDLKLENILIGDSFEAKICDFGFYQELKYRVQTSRGTHGYRAPETYVESNEGYEGDKADIFSLGVILFILTFGVPPFCEATKDDTLYRYFCRGPNSLKFFFRLHPTTK